MIPRKKATGPIGNKQKTKSSNCHLAMFSHCEHVIQNDIDINFLYVHTKRRAHTWTRLLCRAGKTGRNWPTYHPRIMKQDVEARNYTVIYWPGIHKKWKGIFFGRKGATNCACSGSGATDWSDSPMSIITLLDTCHGRDSWFCGRARRLWGGKGVRVC